MIRTKMQLHSAVSSSRDALLCEVVIVNDGTGSRSKGNYDVTLYSRGGTRVIRRARVENYPRLALPAWRLLALAMEALEEADR